MPQNRVPDVVPSVREEDTSHRHMTLALFAAGIATFTDLYAVQGVLPAVARAFDVAPSDAALTISVATAGLAIMVLPWSVVADRIGRLPSMRIAVLSAAVLAVLAAFAPTFGTMLVLRFLVGAALGAVPALAVAYIHEHLSGKAAIAAATVYISGTTVGGAAGRLIAGPLAGLVDWQVALVVVAGISVMAAVSFTLLAPASAPSSVVMARRPWGSKVLAPLRDPVLLGIYLHAFLLVGVFVAVYNYLGFRLEVPPFALPPAVASLIFIAYFSGTASARLAGRIGALHGPRRVIILGLSTMFVGLALMVPNELPVVLLGLVLFTTGYFACHAMATAWVGARADAAWRAQASSLYTVAFYCGSAVGGWLLGIVFQAFGWTPFTVLAAATLVLAGARALRAAHLAAAE